VAECPNSQWNVIERILLLLQILWILVQLARILGSLR
jgi:hypothetical protein